MKKQSRDTSRPTLWRSFLRCFGDKERVIDELERGYHDGPTNYLFIIEVDPLLDDLRAVIRVLRR